MIVKLFKGNLFAMIILMDLHLALGYHLGDTTQNNMNEESLISLQSNVKMNQDRQIPLIKTHNHRIKRAKDGQSSRKPSAAAIHRGSNQNIVSITPVVTHSETPSNPTPEELLWLRIARLRERNRKKVEAQSTSEVNAPRRVSSNKTNGNIPNVRPQTHRNEHFNQQGTKSISIHQNSQFTNEGHHTAASHTSSNNFQDGHINSQNLGISFPIHNQNQFAVGVGYLPNGQSFPIWPG